MTSDEFRRILLEKAAWDIVPEYITADNSGPIVSPGDLSFLIDQAQLVFRVEDKNHIKPIVVGSAKLGFSIVEKTTINGWKPRYREYESGVSDIDLALVSPVIYQKIWRGLALYGFNQPVFPHKSSLGDYMFHGWIRPDKFPLGMPQVCSEWHDFMNKMHRSLQFRNKKLRCAIYHSKYFLDLYQQKAVSIAQSAEKNI